MGLENILIKNGKIWNGNGFEDGDVLIENGIITQTGKLYDCNAQYTFEAQGNIISAGLVDIHSHIYGISSDDYGIYGEASSFPFGVTAVMEPSACQGDKKCLEMLGVKTVVGVCADIKNDCAYMEKTKELLRKYDDKAIAIKLFFSESDDVKSIIPLKQWCDYAKENGLKVIVHTTQSPVPMGVILECLSEGDICTHIYHGGKNTALDDDFISIKDAKKRGVIIDFGMAGYAHTDFSVARAAAKRGIFPDTISSDITSCSAFVRGGRYGLTLCMSFMRTLGMDEKEIFKAVTVNAARAVKKDNEWGKIEKGRCADIAVIEYGKGGQFDITDAAGNNVKNENGYSCLLTVANGKIVYRG